MKHRNITHQKYQSKAEIYVLSADEPQKGENVQDIRNQVVLTFRCNPQSVRKKRRNDTSCGGIIHFARGDL